MSQQSGSLIGKEFTVIKTGEDYTVIEQTGNYLTVQLSAFFRASMQNGKEFLSKN